MLRIYVHPKCSTCQKALAWLAERKIEVEIVDIRETPPTVDELRQMLVHAGKISKLCNTSGMDYRKLGMKEKLAELTDDEALKLLATNGMLVKRPFVLTEKGGLTGFRLAEWDAFLPDHG